MKKSFLSVLLLSLFMVSNTMAGGLSWQQDDGLYHTYDILDDSGQVTFFELVTFTGADQLQKNHGLSDFTLGESHIIACSSFKFQSLSHQKTTGYHQSFLLLIIFPFHSFL